jgi:hypothetical protein
MDKVTYIQGQIDGCTEDETIAREQMAEAGKRMRLAAKKRGELQLDLIKAYKDNGSATTVNESKPAAKVK